MDSVSIETKVLTGFGAVLLVLTAIAALTYQSFRSFIDAFGAVEHTLQVRMTLQQVQGRLIDAQTGTRGYLITGDERYLSPYQSALATLDQDVQRLSALTATNPDQQRRIGELHDRIAPLLASLDRLIALRREQGFEAARAQLVSDAGGRRMAAIRELIAAMDAEEARLLQQRTAASQDSANELTLALELLIGVSVLFFALLLWRVRRDLLSRRRAEEDLAEVARYDRVIGEALALFNASPERGRVLDGVLSLLADTSLYPVSVFYRYDSWSGMLEREAGWGMSAGTATSYRLGEGLVGQAAQARRVLVLDAAAGLPTIDAGVQSLRPAAILVVPIAYQERLLGVLVLASTRAAGARDRTFVERLAAQIGVALHNLQQFADVKALAGELRQRGEEITRKNRELEAANRMKSEFLATMSHELRTPLNAIIGFSEVLRDGLAGDLNPEQRDYVGDIFDSGHHLLALINDILDLSKVEAGAMPLELEAVDVAQCLRNGLAMVREKALAHGLQVDLQLGDGVGVIGADARKCKQILYNLLSNAVKFTPRGGRLELTARRLARGAIDSAGAGEAHVLWLPPAGPYDEFLEIGVADTGIGLSQAELDRLFRPFVQIDSSLARKYSGTGLGLVMVKSLVELHGGGAGVSSTPGRGSRFTVWLPCRAPADTEAVIAPAAARSRGEALALVIEDDDQSAELIRLQLEAEGFAVVRATSGEEGLALATARLPDLITLDLLLPGMDGWACLERLRDDPVLAQVPVVIISILADDARARGLSLGVARVLQKPVGRQALQEAMAALGLSRLADPPPSVLVVDDDPRSVEIIAAYLEEAGFVVMQAYGGRDGIDLAQNTHPALVVLDLMMPEINGFEVVEVLKRRPETADIPILVVTAKQIDAEERARLNGHLLRIVEKAAFSPEDFIREVRRSLRRAANAA